MSVARALAAASLLLALVAAPAQAVPPYPDLGRAGFVDGDKLEWIRDVLVAPDGSIYVGGFTRSDETTFPDGDGFGAVTGFDTTHNGGEDGFVAKLRPDGGGFEWATLLGGDNKDEVHALALNPVGGIVVGGFTASSQATFPDGDPNGDDLFPVPGYDQTHNGFGFDAFVAELSPDGQTLLWATYLGGDKQDDVTTLQVDGSGSVFLGGWGKSDETTFPDGMGTMPPASPNPTHGGDFDGFVARLSPGGASLEYAGFLGGSQEDGFRDSVLMADGSFVLVGWAASDETEAPDGDGFGTIPGADRVHGGGYDGFVAEIAPGGGGIAYASYLGGAGDDFIFGMVPLPTGSFAVAGGTGSDHASFPDGDGFGSVTGPDLTYNGGATDAFVASLGGNGTVEWAGYLGGSGDDRAVNAAMDPAGGIHVLGRTDSTEATFPVSIGPDLTANGDDDLFLTEVKVDGSGFGSSGFIGGAEMELAEGLDHDAAGNPVVVGGTFSSEATFPDGLGLGVGGYSAIDGLGAALTDPPGPFAASGFVVIVEGPRSCGGNVATIVAGLDGPILEGTSGDDVIVVPEGLNGITVNGGDGSDAICVESAGVTVDAGNGDDTVIGSPGRQILKGGAGRDKLVGKGGRDTLNGGGGKDLLKGGGGRDKLVGKGGRDTLNGGGGKDLLKGGGGRDKLVGKGGPDKLRGQGGPDLLRGGGGNDMLNGGGARDTCEPGGGKRNAVKRCER